MKYYNDLTLKFKEADVQSSYIENIFLNTLRLESNGINDSIKIDLYPHLHIFDFS